MDNEFELNKKKVRSEKIERLDSQKMEYLTYLCDALGVWKEEGMSGIFGNVHDQQILTTETLWNHGNGVSRKKSVFLLKRKKIKKNGWLGFIVYVCDI